MARLPCRSQGRPGHVAASSRPRTAPWSCRRGPGEQGCASSLGQAEGAHPPALSGTDSSCVPTPDKLHVRFYGNRVSQAAPPHGLDAAVILGHTEVILVYKAKPESEGRTPETRHFQRMRKGPAQSCCGGRGFGVDVPSQLCLSVASDRSFASWASICHLQHEFRTRTPRFHEHHHLQKRPTKNYTIPRKRTTAISSHQSVTPVRR